MRLLFLTNFYPPASRGGYEMWCQEVVTRLEARGHEITVLTSRYQSSDVKGESSERVHRQLYLEMDFTPLLNGIRFFVGRKAREQKNILYLTQLIEHEAPDAILVWGMWNLQRSLPACAERLMPNRVAYYLGDYWPTLPTQSEMYWQTADRHWLTRLPKRVLRSVATRVLERQSQPSLALTHGLFPTQYMRDELESQGVSFQKSEVIYGAIDTSPYLALQNKHVALAGDAHSIEQGESPAEQPLSLLYIGRLIHEKGVHTAIEALGYLVHQHKLSHLKLTIVGSGKADYEAYLHELVQQEKLAPYVDFLGWLPEAQLPELYQSSDIFLFTSIWAEPFGRVLIEAMASGVAVVGTGTGGAAEILSDGENSLLFEPNNGEELAEKIMRLYEMPELYHKLIAAGRQSSVEKFDVQIMSEQIEGYLKSHVI